MLTNKIRLYTSFFISLLSTVLPAFCQKTYDPNLSHFYMGRQQITIEDNSPIVNDKTGGTAGGGNAGMTNMPNRAVPLPKAGWQGYAPIESPGANPNLPKVPRPVRQSHNLTGHQTTGLKGHTGAVNQRKQSPGYAVKGYQPYAKYPPPTVNSQAAQDLDASTHVKGSLLHWARKAPRQQ